jgi:hypothetical protein
MGAELPTFNGRRTAVSVLRAPHAVRPASLRTGLPSVLSVETAKDELPCHYLADARVLPHIGDPKGASYGACIKALKAILPLVRGRHWGGQRPGCLRSSFPVPAPTGAVARIEVTVLLDVIQAF